MPLNPGEGWGGDSKGGAESSSRSTSILSFLFWWWSGEGSRNGLNSRPLEGGRGGGKESFISGVRIRLAWVKGLGSRPSFSRKWNIFPSEIERKPHFPTQWGSNEGCYAKTQCTSVDEEKYYRCIKMQIALEQKRCFLSKKRYVGEIVAFMEWAKRILWAGTNRYGRREIIDQSKNNDYGISVIIIHYP